MLSDKSAFMTDAPSNKQLLDSAERLLPKMLAEIEDYAIIFLDAAGTITNWNKGAEKIHGYTESQAIGQNFTIFYPDDAKANDPQNLLREASINGRAVYEGWRRRGDQSLFWGSIVLTALHDVDGNVIGFVKVTRDLTERKTAEDILKAKNVALEAINQELASFAYVASHDLQEPLRKIHTFLSRIAEMEKDKLSEKSQDFFKRIQSAAQRMQQLIQDLLAYSRTSIEGKSFENVDLNEILTDLRKDMAEEINEKKAIVESETLPTVYGIRFQLNQLLTNLINNSLKFAKEDVAPVIRVRSETLSGRSLNSLGGDPQRKYYHISFQDNGIGFDPEFNSKVFDLFQRLHGRSEYAGTGIGLSICKKITQNHQGLITADGHEGKGATFHVYLPVPN